MMYALVPYTSFDAPTSTRRDQKFSGLSNQGATCYMNSLLQSLFMTPEFRKKIYIWTYDERKHGEKKDCIPYQLQLLFGKLQIARSPYVETKALTKSFGWDIKESFQQHDVQEFCRVLFDAIEESVKGTPDENMINSMYEGIYTDYVKCLNCKHESKRQDKFLDLSLTVRNDFDKIYNDSVEKALRSYIKPDKLTGDNQYFCENCNAKQDALKGLKFERLPYFLVLQLKRFDLDYNTFQRIKLNDRVTFPQILNANPYVGDITEETIEETPTIQHVEEEKKEELPYLDVIPQDLDSRSLVQIKNSKIEYLSDDRDKKPTKIDQIVKDKIIAKQAEERKASQHQQIEEYLKQGENVYELFSIMIHSGSALGGHYYAYIKSFDDASWSNFNDSYVKGIEEREIEKVYGGKGNTKGWDSGYSANAYLLMYRKVAPENIIKIEDSEVPPIIKEELVNQVEKDKEEQAERIEKYKSLTLKLYYGKKEISINIKKDENVKAIKDEAIKAFKITEIKPENIRIRGYSVYYDIFQDVYDEEKTVESQQIWNWKVLGVETKNDSEEWPPYDPNQITIKVNVWSSEMEDSTKSFEEKTSNPHKIIISKKDTVGGMMAIFEQKFNISQDKQVILKKTYMGMTTQCEIVNAKGSLGNSLSYAKIYEGSILYLEESDEASKTPKWQQQLDLESRRYVIRFNHPDDVPNYANQLDYKLSVVLDCYSTLQTLKEMISAKLNLSIDDFIMKRGGKHCQEIKDLTIKLTQASLVNNSVIFIERGKPTKPNEYRIIFSLATEADEAEGDAVCYKFIDLFDLPLDAGMMVSEVKNKICEKLNEMYPSMGVEVAKIRLRERNSDKLARILRKDDILRQYALYEKKNISIQILETESVESSKLVTIVKRWWPSTWQVSKPVEVFISKTSTLEEFGNKLSSAFDIPIEKLEVTKITYSWNFSRTDLTNEIFYRVKGNMNVISQNPWFLTMDGNLFFVKDKTEATRDLTEEEKKKFNKSSSYTSSYGYTSTTTTWKYEPPKEEAMKITVKKKNHEEEKRNDEERSEDKETEPDLEP